MLRRSLSTHGIVDPLVWNERTGHLVGGHQRMMLMDEAAAGADYELDVAAIHVEPAEERRINVLLNQEGMMGEWDIEKLREVFGTETFDAADFGFGYEDLGAMFGESFLVEEEPVQQPVAKAVVAGGRATSATAAPASTAGEVASPASPAADVGEGTTLSTALIAFETSDARGAFVQAHALGEDGFEEYIDGDALLRLLG